jgi:hypothetical protein
VGEREVGTREVSEVESDFGFSQGGLSLFGSQEPGLGQEAHDLSPSLAVHAAQRRESDDTRDRPDRIALLRSKQFFSSIRSLHLVEIALERRVLSCFLSSSPIRGDQARQP